MTRMINKVPNGEDSLVFFDLETSGLDPDKDCIIDIGAVRIGSRSTYHVKKFWTKVLPTCPVKRTAAKINGYSKKKWENAKQPKEAAKKLLEFLQPGDKLVAHNVAFDMAFLDKFVGQGNIEKRGVDYHHLDTASMAYLLKEAGVIKADSLSLRNLVDVDEDTHLAIEDAEFSIQLYRKLLYSAKPWWKKFFGI